MNKQKTSLTFIELLIGITIFAILSLAVFNSISIGLKVARRAEYQLKISHKANRFLDSLSRELSNAVYFYVSDENRVGFTGATDKLSFFCLRSVFDENIPTLQKLVRVSYLFQDEHIFREQMDEVIFLNEPVFSEEIDIKVSKLKFLYFNKTIEDEETEFLDVWEEQDLPFGIRVEFILYDEQDDTEIAISRNIFLPLIVSAQAEG